MMRIFEILNKPKSSTKTKPFKSAFEKNAAKLRSKERGLNPQSPIAPIKHRV